MFNALPVTMTFTVLLWASVIYILIGCMQLILFDSIAKKEDPSANTYSKMSPKNKKAIRKAFIKVMIGLLTLIILAVIDKFVLVK
jgi:archaellum biogenesis protein FlaJ (TadC family)